MMASQPKTDNSHGAVAPKKARDHKNRISNNSDPLRNCFQVIEKFRFH